MPLIRYFLKLFFFIIDKQKYTTKFKTKQLRGPHPWKIFILFYVFMQLCIELLYRIKL